MDTDDALGCWIYRHYSEAELNKISYDE
jgi:hypothetical protein